MKVDIAGRIANIRLGEKRSLYPLFEAIVNSIHSISSLKIKDGHIKIIVKRDLTQKDLFDGSIESQPISHFVIEDNGIGFYKINFDSFETSDTKVKKGAKGIGRFMWLKAFDSVKIESTFGSNGNTQKRTFDFLVTKKGIENAKVSPAKDSTRKTIVELKSLKAKYQKYCPKTLQTIGERIVEHCLIHFLSNSCPEISIEDDSTKIVLNQLFSNTIKNKIKPNMFTIKGEQFKVINLQLYSSDERKHQAHFCGHDRVVKSIDLSKRILDLNSKLRDENGETFKYASYITSAYLDDNVNPERTDFYIEDESDSLFPNVISFDEIESETVNIARTYLREFLKPIAENKIAQINSFVETQAPQYRATVKLMSEELENIPPNLSNEKLDLELHKLKTKKQAELKLKTQELIRQKVENDSDANTFVNDFNKVFSEISDISKDQLAEYILYRKSIISLLDKSLGLNDVGKYHRKDAIHKIIFPMRKSSDDIDLDEQNLWLIDERLSYHYFLSSDKPFNKIDILDSQSKDRPDILIFNNAMAYAEAKAPISSVVIIEFKRPMRSAYDETEDNPFEQIIRYITEIRESKLTDKNGRLLEVQENTPFYAYIICDLTPKLRNIAKNMFGYTQTPDGLGYFDFNKNINAYIEIISYTKLVEDAKKRNNILFDKLGLPR